MIKYLFLLLIAELSVVRADVIQGQNNKPLNFINTNTVSIYYSITLDANITLDWNNEPGISESGYLVVNTLIDSNLVPAPTVNGTGFLCNSGLCLISPGSHTITYSTNLVLISNHATVNPLTTISFTVQTATPTDYTQTLSDLQSQLTTLQGNVNNQGGTNVALLSAQSQQLSNISSAISTTQSAILASNDGLNSAFSNQITSLKEQIAQIKSTLSSLSTVDQHISDVDSHVAEGNQISTSISNSANQNTASILSAIDGLSQQIDTVNNNVVTGNKNNQTLGIIGISLGGAGIGTAIGMPFLMQGGTNPSTDVNFSPSSDRENINYISPGGKND